MKKFLVALTALFTLTLSANAMGYEQARQQALFLTDKMAYELNLTDEQYANFREVKVGNIGAGKLYRSSSPVNPEINRNSQAAAAAEAAAGKAAKK